MLPVPEDNSFRNFLHHFALLSRIMDSFTQHHFDAQADDSGYSDNSGRSSPAIHPVPSSSSIATSKLIKWSIPPPSTLVVLPGWEPMPYGMEQFWSSAFAYYFKSFLESDSHLWTLTPVNLPPVSTHWKWHQASYSAKVRFRCPEHQGWTSMKGRVFFWYRLWRQGDQILAEVLFKIYGQQCNQCPYSMENYLPALWYYEEIVSAIQFLRSEVAKTYYGGYKERPPRSFRQGRTRNFHDPSLCQACSHGLCIL